MAKTICAIGIPSNVEETNRIWEQMAMLAEASSEIVIFMTGLDDDPREVWEVEEARKAWLRAAELVLESGYWDKLNDESIAAMRLCWSVEKGKTVRRINEQEMEIID